MEEDQFTDESTPMQTFISDLDTFLKSFKTCLSPSACEAFVTLVTAEIALQMEKAVLKNKFNRIGGLQLDKELRILVGYLTTATTWLVRDKFSRLTQMTILLTLEKIFRGGRLLGKRTRYVEANCSRSQASIVPEIGLSS